MDTEAHLDGVIDMISEERDLLQAENERLRALVIRAYAEGFGDGWGEYDEQLSEGVERDWCWERSDTRAALQPKEGDQ